MDLLCIPVGQLETFTGARKVGEACEEEGFIWFEDPFRDRGTSQHVNRTLGDMIDTSLMRTEHVGGFKPHTDFAVNDGADYPRTDPRYDWDYIHDDSTRVVRFD